MQQVEMLNIHMRQVDLVFCMDIHAAVRAFAAVPIAFNLFSTDLIAMYWHRYIHAVYLHKVSGCVQSTTSATLRRS
jgi:hypothetical protein